MRDQMFDPDMPDPYLRGPGLTAAEGRWLEQRAAEQPEHRRVRRPNRPAEQMLMVASECSTAVRNATVAVPPPNRRELGSRGIVGPSDPALAQVVATHQAVERACVRLGHVLDDCQTCDGGMALSCNTNRHMTVARLVGWDLTELADHLVALSPTSPRAIGQVTAQFDTTMARAATAVVDVWDGMHRSGAETDVLRDYVGQVGEVIVRLQQAKGMLAHWLPGVQVRLCRAGCGGAAPREGEGATCVRCRKRASRESA